MSIVQYNPLPPVTEGTFLRAGWTPQVINGVVPDLSGLGHDGTLATVKPAFECDSFFGPTLRTYANEAGFTFPCTLGVTTVGTWGIWYRVPTLVLPASTLAVLISRSTANDNFLLNVNGSARLALNITLGGVARSLANAVLPSRIGVWELAIATYDGDKVRLYTDGVLTDTSASWGGAIDNWNAGTGRIAHYSAATFSLDGNLRAPFILNRCWSDADVAAYYALAKTAQFKTDYGALVSLAIEGGTIGSYVSNTAIQFADAGTRARVDVETVNSRSTKVLTCTAAGQLHLTRQRMQQEAGAAAFGTWETTFLHAAGNTSYPVAMCLNPPTDYTGYVVSVSAAGAIALVRVNNAGAPVSTVMQSANGYIADNTYFKLTVNRTVAGVWTMYVNDVLVPATGGGANPGTDATNLVASGWFMIPGVGDKLTLGSVDGANCTRKTLK